MLKTVPFLLFAGATAFISSSTIRDARGTSAAFKVPVVTVHAKEFGYTSPASITAGQTTFRLVNDGKQLHHLTIIKLAKGKTFADLQAAVKSAGPPPTWMTEMGGPNATVPGGSTEATLTLDAGNYVLLCWIPSPGEEMPHAMKGMMQALAVVPAGGVTQAGAVFAPTPTPDVHLVLKDYGLTLSKPLTAGKHVFHVMNQGPQTHEATLLKLAPGKHIADFNAWVMSGMKGPPPAMPQGGMTDLAKGGTAIFSADLTPGTYGLICFVPDEKDHKTHAEHGMTTEFVVK